MTTDNNNNQTFSIAVGDVLAVLKQTPSNTYDACLSDPPYGLEFMGKDWDKAVPSVETLAELYRVMKPGAFLLLFGGTRTWHRLAVHLEDAGFTLRDTLMWLYGSGFPKSHNIGKALDKAAGAQRTVVGTEKNWGATTAAEGRQAYGDYSGEWAITTPATEAAALYEGYGTALKPAWEPCLLVQKPLAGTFANNVMQHGCGALNIEGCRIGDEARFNSYGGASSSNPLAGASVGGTAGGFNVGKLGPTEVQGRFPANLLLDDSAAEVLGEQSRFFYCAKVSTKERNAGLGDSFEVKAADHRDEVAAGIWAEKGVAPARNNHPTLKPIALTEYLAKLLLLPTDGRLLVPYSGAGSEMIGALRAGWATVDGIELSQDFADIAAARIAHHTEAQPV